MKRIKENYSHGRSNQRRVPQPGLALLLLGVVALLASACGGPPTEAISGAEDALLNAAWAEECAGETYRSAQKMLQEAKAANEAGNYDEARRKADAAMRLAEQARKDADLNKEECEKRKNAMATIEDKLDEGNADKSDVEVKEELKLQTVYFDFDQSVLTSDSQDRLDENARWLKSNDTSKVRIEGHTDSRGSTEYNLALSQRRAQSVKRYMQALGIDPTRMTVVPYGEEKPAAYGSTETDHAKNRRAEFVPY